jgi:hypothetical protein
MLTLCCFSWQANGMGESLLSRTSASIIKLVDRMKWYPAVTIVVWILPTAIRVGEAGGWHSHVVEEIARFFVYLQGFMDCVAYVLTSPVISMWEVWWRHGRRGSATAGKSSGSSRQDRRERGDDDFEENNFEDMNGEGDFYDEVGNYSDNGEDMSARTSEGDQDISPIYTYSVDDL